MKNVGEIGLVKGIAQNGKVLYYTGRAGEAWVSPELHQAFDGFNLEGAKLKAEQFNRYTGVHGVRFKAEIRDLSNVDWNLSETVG